MERMWRCLQPCDSPRLFRLKPASAEEVPRAWLAALTPKEKGLARPSREEIPLGIYERIYLLLVFRWIRGTGEVKDPSITVRTSVPLQPAWE
jgi:hypothetical protein